ncbi:MAG: NAD(P)/FAD-dependent oxidoreductase [Candidatus Hermodarchaeota archaeon]
MSNQIEYCDIVIIGGSIAGNYLSYLLFDSKLKIVVIEEHKEIGSPLQCAGIISKKLKDLIYLPEDIVLNRVKVAKIISPSGKVLKLSGNEEPYVIDRIGLDKLFYEKIKDFNDIKYYLGEKFISFEYINKKHQDYLIIQTSKRKLKSKMLIGCDGPLSRVAKILGVKNKIIYGTQIRIQSDFNENEALMWFDPRWKELFGWIVPEGNKIYRIGLASATNLSKNFKIFLKKLNVNYNKRINQQGGIIPYGTMKKSSFNNIILLGDSAGQVKATTGGGIIMLLIASKYAARCIKLCFKHNNFSKRFIRKHYEKLCLAAIGKQLKIHYILRRLFETFTNKDFETLFRIIKQSNIEEMISLYGDMDFPRELIFKLLKNRIAIWFIIKFLMKHPLAIFKML